MCNTNTNTNTNVNKIDINNEEEKVDLPFRDLIEAKNKTDIFLNISNDDKKKLINLNSWGVKAFELSILERLSKKNLKVNQGEIWSVDLGENVGSEMNKTRPCVILSMDCFNDSSMATIVPITNSDTNFPSQVKVDALGVGDILTGTVKTEQIKTISKARLGKKICEANELINLNLIQYALMKHIGIDSSIIKIIEACSNEETKEDVMKYLRIN